MNKFKGKWLLLLILFMPLLMGAWWGATSTFKSRIVFTDNTPEITGTNGEYLTNATDGIWETDGGFTIGGNLITSTVGSPFVKGRGAFASTELADTIEISGVTATSPICVTPVGTAAITAALVITTKTDTIICYRAEADTAAFTNYIYFGTK